MIFLRLTVPFLVYCWSELLTCGVFMSKKNRTDQIWDLPEDKQDFQSYLNQPLLSERLLALFKACPCYVGSIRSLSTEPIHVFSHHDPPTRDFVSGEIDKSVYSYIFKWWYDLSACASDETLGWDGAAAAEAPAKGFILLYLRDVVAGSYSTVQCVLGMLVSFLMAGLGTY